MSIGIRTYMYNPQLERQFKQFLYYDRKLDKSRERQIQSSLNIFGAFFRDKPFSRPNFLSFIEHLTEKGYTSGTLNNYISLAKNFCKFLKIADLDGFKFFKIQKKVVEKITPQEIVKLSKIKIHFARYSKHMNETYKLLILLLGTTGLRISEALSLKKEDMKDECIIVRNTKTDVERVVPVDKHLWNCLKSLNLSPLVFTSYRGNKITPQMVGNILREKGEKAGIRKHLHPHAFRHSYITEMLEQGVNINDVADIVGHADIQTTREYNSQTITHLRTIALRHPLLQKNLSFADLKSDLKSYIDRAVYKAKYSLSVSEDTTSLTIYIKKAYA